MLRALVLFGSRNSRAKSMTGPSLHWDVGEQLGSGSANPAPLNRRVRHLL